MDFVTHLPKIKSGYDALLVMVDYVTKMMILRPTYSVATTVDTARLFVDSVVRAHGLPRVIVSDWDTRFTSHFWREVHRVLCTVSGFRDWHSMLLLSSSGTERDCYFTLFTVQYCGLLGASPV